MNHGETVAPQLTEDLVARTAAAHHSKPQAEQRVPGRYLCTELPTEQYKPLRVGRPPRLAKRGR
jgi:hypothetical protein